MEWRQRADDGNLTGKRASTGISTYLDWTPATRNATRRHNTKRAGAETAPETTVANIHHAYSELEERTAEPIARQAKKEYATFLADTNEAAEDTVATVARSTTQAVL